MKHFWTVWMLLMNIALSISDVVYHVPEEQSAGIFIGNIAFDSSLNVNMSDDDFRTLRYSFLTGDSLVRSMFTLNQSTGNLYTTDKIDRETVCQYLESCLFSFQTAAQSTIKSFFKKITVNIFIDDINDHSPLFDSPKIDLEISESVLVGTAFNINGARDLDTSPSYSLQKHILEPDNLPFSLSSIKNLDGTSVVRLVVGGPLDREIRNSYQLKIIAQDGGLPIRSAELHVNVSILDENDNAPMLSNSIYNVTVKEGVSSGYVVLKLQAYDLDLGRNAEVRYVLSPVQSDTIKSLFSVNATSGELYVLSSLSHGTYKIIVEVSDMGVQPLTTQAHVFVTIEDTGNNPPKIHVNLLSAGDVASISEGATMGQAVAHIVVEDHDSGNNGIVACLLNTKYFALQGLDINEFKVIVVEPLDRETSSSHLITVTCRDAGYPPLSFSRAFLVEILDVNDNPPIFSMNVYSASIAENNAVGDSLIRVVANDADFDQNAHVRYMIPQINSSLVQIESETGLVRTNAVLDRELMPNGFTFSVIAFDGGSPALYGTATVSVKINDVNDHTPEFAENLFIFIVEENVKLGSRIGSLTAFDRDEGDNGKVVFSSGSDTISSPFVLYSDGKIKTAKPIDREVTKSYNFTVTASDLGSPARSSTARINIFIADQNDNSPIILFPTTNNKTVRIPKTTLPGTVVSRIRAVDPDEGMNGSLEYLIDSRNDSGVFLIYPQLGDIVLQKSVGHLSGKKFILSLIISDRGIPKMSSYGNLEIIIGKEETSGLQTNIVIVVALVGATVITSACIVVAICIVRRLDFHRRNSKNKQIAQVSNSTNSNNVLINDNGATDDQNLENERKKKEVTFAFHVIDNPQNQMRFETRTNINGPVGTYGDPLNQKILRHQEDNNSETSGETNTSDSGRGLSDDEINLQKGKDRRRQTSNIHLHPNLKSSHPFFHDGRVPISPIDHPKRLKFSFDPNATPSPNKEMEIIGNTFYYHPKSPSFEEDSGSTSGIHTIDEDVHSVHFANNVV
ncbi:protocadherin-9-like [Mytilus galloprovincialis]|uniref:protocadherin-9-like n=1 Tax=Mytilus galloprovincialis TaxID=29158 RepID=UPI003F7BF500